MGTNYYTKTKTCSTCGHKPEGIHLGKSSAGWQFCFQYNGGKYYKNFKEMKDWLRDKEIEDEYGATLSSDDFFLMVKGEQKRKLNHFTYCKEHHPEIMEHEYLINGYSFSDVDFC